MTIVSDAATWTIGLKLFMAVPGRPFQPSLLFRARPGVYPRVIVIMIVTDDTSYGYGEG